MNSVRIVLYGFAIVCATLAMPPASAHHSPAALYDLSKVITIEGVVTEYRFINPHIRFYLDVAGADGTTQSWLAEGGTRAVLLRRGWSGAEVKAGEVIRIVGNPARDGSPLIHCLSIVLPNGQRLASEDLDPAVLDSRRK
jgi:Family of unknown function (DUF6152)